MAQLDPNGVPILDLSDKSLAQVEDNNGLMTGEVVYLENRTVGGHTFVKIGGETLDEALKSVVGLFDIHHSGPPGDPNTFDPPGWIASSNDRLGKLLAEHYGCELRPVEDIS